MLPAKEFQRADRILSEITNADNPIVVIGSTQTPLCGDICSQLELENHDIFILNHYTANTGFHIHSFDPEHAIYRNALITFSEILYILKNMKNGRLWLSCMSNHTNHKIEPSVADIALTLSLMRMTERPIILEFKNDPCTHDTNNDQASINSYYHNEILSLANKVVTSETSNGVV